MAYTLRRVSKVFLCSVPILAIGFAAPRPFGLWASTTPSEACCLSRSLQRLDTRRKLDPNWHGK